MSALAGQRGKVKQFNLNTSALAMSRYPPSSWYSHEPQIIIAAAPWAKLRCAAGHLYPAKSWWK